MSRSTKLDANQVIKRVFDDDNDALVVRGVDAIVRDLSADVDSVSIADVTNANKLLVNVDGSINVNAAATSTPSIVDTTALLNALAANADHTSAAIECLSYQVVGLMANWATLDQTDATLKFQGSLDNSVWDDIGSAYSIASASGHKSFFLDLNSDPYKYFRAVYTKGTNTTGTVTVKYVMRA